MHVPESTLPAMDLEWKIPEVWNAFERNRGRAYHLVLTTVVAFENWLVGLDLLKQGHTKVHTPFETPRKGFHIGAGFWGAGRGYLRTILTAAGCEVHEIRGELNPGFGGIYPEPIERNLAALVAAVRDGRADLGLATDGDADRNRGPMPPRGPNCWGTVMPFSAARFCISAWFAAAIC